MTLTRSIVTHQLAFTNKKFVDLLEDMTKFFKERGDAYTLSIEDAIITWDNFTNCWVATIYRDEENFK